MTSRRFFLPLLAAGLLLALGALPAVAKDKGATVKRPRSAEKGPAKKSARDRVKAIDVQGLRSLLEASRGEVLVLNFWATWCKPCIREFPVMVEAARRFEKKGVRVVAISMDAPKARPRVEKFVARFGGPMQIYQGGFGEEAAFIALTEPNWTGSLPATVFYDPAGDRAFTHVGALDAKSLNGAIESLLEVPKKR
jgi:thiol-disulfide isomerase/thioredoxin